MSVHARITLLLAGCTRSSSAASAAAAVQLSTAAHLPVLTISEPPSFTVAHVCSRSSNVYW
jgi:acetyl-CoA carboxylase carboxyltransferase component